MTKRDPQRTVRLRIAVRHLLNKGFLWEGKSKGLQSQLGKHFKVSRQRVHQIVVEERETIRSEFQKRMAIAS